VLYIVGPNAAPKFKRQPFAAIPLTATAQASGMPAKPFLEKLEHSSAILAVWAFRGGHGLIERRRRIDVDIAHHTSPRAIAAPATAASTNLAAMA
jgi:hypothetical protein